MLEEGTQREDTSRGHDAAGNDIRVTRRVEAAAGELKHHFMRRMDAGRTQGEDTPSRHDAAAAIKEDTRLSSL